MHVATIALVAALAATLAGQPQPQFELASIKINRTTRELPSFFTAVKEQLGLKLDADTAPIEVFVITTVERPSKN